MQFFFHTPCDKPLVRSRGSRVVFCNSARRILSEFCVFLGCIVNAESRPGAVDGFENELSVGEFIERPGRRDRKPDGTAPAA